MAARVGTSQDGCYYPERLATKSIKSIAEGINMDRLTPLLAHFSPKATLYFHGSSCQKKQFCPQSGQAYLQLIEAGQGAVVVNGQQFDITEACLLFLPRGSAHQFLVEPPQRLLLYCATLDCGETAGNPLLAALPDCSIIPLSRCSSLRAIIQLIWQENQSQSCGRDAALQRLTEYLLILLLRHVLAENSLQTGFIAGLADKKLAAVFSALHQQPELEWTLEAMALEAGMSRARFASHFRAVVGQTPADYLLNWRLTLARKQLMAGQTLKQIAPKVGYQSVAAFHRAFRQRLGVSPKVWLNQVQLQQHPA